MDGFLETFKYFNFLLIGIRWTIQISAMAVIGGSVIGIFAALARLSGMRLLESASSFYIDLFRVTPFTVQLIWIYYALPLLTNFSFSNVNSGAIALSLYAGSFIAEIIRAGILSIPKGQTEAAQAIGMKSYQVMRRIIMPQAVVRMLPPLTSVFISLVKDSSICSLVGVPELMRQTHALGGYIMRRMEVLTIVGFLYFALTYPLGLLQNKLYERFSTDL